ncbi:Fic family protein [Arabiibacter massiliensis]|uniref:Fic family protein n=1 Tax=Arabiibacter massiliensis TaxID=1870985 RepID=UPI0009B9BE17|nr:Fic family protein [Arabiibacter massiliensis]
MYLHEHTDWTRFSWDAAELAPLLCEASFARGELRGLMEHVGFQLEAEMEVDALAGEVVASSLIEGVELDAAKVRSSVSRQLGLEEPGAVDDTRDVDGVVSVMMDATRNCDAPLMRERLCGWHNALFPTGYSGLRRIAVARFRERPMSVVSGPVGREKVHFRAPEAERVGGLMDEFLAWFDVDSPEDPLVKAGIAHLWFLTIHPFDDGNGRIARALTEMLLARADRSPRRYYSMARHVLSHREGYYAALERAQKGTSDATEWLAWFLRALTASIEESACAVRGALERETFWKSLEGVPLNERQRSMLSRLKGGFEGKLTSRKWAKMCKVSPDTALRDINDLVEKGVLEREAGGGRSTSYAVRPLS